MPLAAQQQVVARAAAQRIIAAITIERVIATPCLHRIIAAISMDQIVKPGADKHVCAAAGRAKGPIARIAGLRRQIGGNAKRFGIIADQRILKRSAAVIQRQNLRLRGNDLQRIGDCRAFGVGDAPVMLQQHGIQRLQKILRQRRAGSANAIRHDIGRAVHHQHGIGVHQPDRIGDVHHEGHHRAGLLGDRQRRCTGNEILGHVVQKHAVKAGLDQRDSLRGDQRLPIRIGEIDDIAPGIGGLVQQPVGGCAGRRSGIGAVRCPVRVPVGAGIIGDAQVHIADHGGSGGLNLIQIFG